MPIAAIIDSQQMAEAFALIKQLAHQVDELQEEVGELKCYNSATNSRLHALEHEVVCLNARIKQLECNAHTHSGNYMPITHV